MMAHQIHKTECNQYQGVLELEAFLKSRWEELVPEIGLKMI